MIRGKFNKKITNRDLKETNGDNDIQTAFIFQCNLQTNLNTCPTVSLALETCAVKFLWLLSEPHAHCSFHRVIVRKAFPRKMLF